MFQIHGAHDRTFPAALTRAEAIVPEGQHALPLFSPEEVDEFLQSVVDRAS